MNKLKLLTIREVQHFMSISRDTLFKHTVDQLRRQHYHLKNLRIRQLDLIKAFDKAILHSEGTNIDIDSWAKSSKETISHTFDKIVVEGTNWRGQGVGIKSLRRPLNEICHHSLHAMLCLDLLLTDAPEVGLTPTDVELRPFIERISRNVGSLSKEKFGVCPDIQIHGDLHITIIPPTVEFAIVEILKNSIKALIDRYGALDIDDAPPIEVYLKKAVEIPENVNSKRIGIGRLVLHDRGVGMSRDGANRYRITCD